MKRYELLIFDWDGTLMDSAGTIVACIQTASADLGWPVPSREAASHIIGLGLKEAVHALFPQMPDDEHPRPPHLERLQVHRHALGRAADLNDLGVDCQGLLHLRNGALGHARRLDLRPIITAHYDLAQTVEAIAKSVERTDGKIMVHPN